MNRQLAEVRALPPAEELVKENLGLVHRIARRYSRFRPDLADDLVQVGCIGLLKAAKYYDPHRARHASFKTLAVCYIQGEIKHFLRDHSGLVQVPRRLGEINSRVSQIEEMLSRELEHAPTVHELSLRSGYSIQEIRDAQQSWDACAHYESFESPEDHEEKEEGGRALSEVVADKKYQDFVLAAEDREILCKALGSLGDKTRQIVEFVYFYDLTQKETAQKLGISEMGVSRAVRSGLKKLKLLLATEIF